MSRYKHLFFGGIGVKKNLGFPGRKWAGKYSDGFSHRLSFSMLVIIKT
jgi:hypothetical protein